VKTRKRRQNGGTEGCVEADMKSFDKNRGRGVSLYVALALIVLAVCGCSSMSRPFKSSKGIDMAPFAENTINLLVDIKHGMQGGMAVYLRDYMSLPAVQEYRTSWLEYRPILRGIAAYSIAIVTLSKSNLTETQRSDKLAEFLDKLLRPVAMSPDSRVILSEEELDIMLANIRGQKNFLDALNAAQPLVDDIARFSHEYLDLMRTQLDAARGALDQRVRDDHAASLAFYKILIETQNLSFEGLTLVREYRTGHDKNALARLLEKDPPLAEILPASKAATLEDVMAIENRLLYRLEHIRELTEQVQPDLDLYRSKIYELDQMWQVTSENIAKTRITVMIWSRAHRGLAQGITNPAKFDIMGVAKQALGAAVPVP